MLSIIELKLFLLENTILLQQHEVILRNLSFGQFEVAMEQMAMESNIFIDLLQKTKLLLLLMEVAN
jgi:hypothetical protein